MKGDFSRGFNPDRKRGREYRRVLAQEGRLLLDSDVNALVDAADIDDDTTSTVYVSGTVAITWINLGDF